MAGSKIKRVTIHYPETKEGVEELNRRYNKALAKVLIETLPPNIIEDLIVRLEQR